MPSLSPSLKAAISREIQRRGIRLLAPGETEDVQSPPAWFHEGQLKAWGSNATDVVVVAGSQGGKTAMQSHWLLREIQRCAPLIRELGRGAFLYVGPTLTLLEQQAIPQFRETFEGYGTFRGGGKPSFTFSPSGSRRILGFEAPITVHFAYANDSSNLESITALAAVWDEAGQKENKIESWRALGRRLTLARSKGYGRVLWGSTPYEWNWFKTYIHDPAQDGRTGELFNFSSWMNPQISEEMCRKELDDGMPLEVWQMFRLGWFTKPRGRIYDSYDPARNQCRRFEIPDDWPIHIGVDFGSNNTAAVYLAEELHEKTKQGTGRFYLYRTYAPPEQRSIQDHAAAIIEPLSKRPTAAGGSHQEEGWREAFHQHGLWIREPYENDVEVQIQSVYAALKTGRLIVFDDLDKIISEFGTYARELDGEGNPTDKIKDKASYHRLDALRYIATVSLRPPVDRSQRKEASRYSLNPERVM